MSEDNERQQDETEIARQHRLDALRSLADYERNSLPSEKTSPKSSAAHSRRWQIFLAVALVGVLVGTGVFARLGHTAHPRSRSTAHLLNASVLQLPDQVRAPNGQMYPSAACPQEAAWSPDGTMLAVIGKADCDASTIIPNEVAAIYAVHDGQARIVGSSFLDGTIAQSILPKDSRNQLDPEVLRQFDIQFSHLVWLPSTEPGAAQASLNHIHELAAVVVVRHVLPGQDAASARYFAAGAVLITMSSNTIGGGVTSPVPAQGFSEATTQEASQSSYLFAPVLTFRWRIAQVGTGGGPGIVGSIAQLGITKASAVALPPALGYSWVKDDKLGITLDATQPLATSPGAPPLVGTPGPIGNPNGDTSFSAWQNGLLTFGSAACPPSGAASSPVSGAYYLLSLGTSSWSPDGQYLITGLGATGRLAMNPPAASNSGSSLGGACQHLPLATNWSQMPVRDGGLGSAAASLDLHHNSQVVVAWSPDGRRLAVAPSASALSTSAQQAAGLPLLTIYDCQTGKALTRLTLAQLKQVDPKFTMNGTVGVSNLQWALDGQHLLLLDPSRHALVIVGPQWLGV